MKLLFYLIFPIIVSGLYDYNQVLVKDSILIAQQTYCNNTFINNQSFTEKVLEIGYNKAILGYNFKYNTIYVAFRGSSNLKNWINNIHFNKIYPYSEFPNIGVEKGFHNIYRLYEIPLFSNILFLSKKYDTKNILLTGHSLGAALSTLLAFDIEYNDAYENFNIYSLITFGSPRVGNKEFTEKFKKINSFRITHFYDIVPHLPQNIFKYKHICQEIWYNEDNTEYKICNDINDEDKTCSNSCAPTKCTSSADHLNYLNITMGASGC